jgi:hypothetical protein
MRMLQEGNTRMKKLVWLLVILLIIFHQDNWNWNNDRLILGFVPVGLGYHAGISIAASVTWFLATKFAWPDDLADKSRPAEEGARP